MNSDHAGRLLWAIVVGVVLGLACGAIFGPAMVGVKWLGELFLNALKMTIIPLIVAAVITGVASLGDVRKLGRVGGLTVLYYASTTAVAVAIGLVVVNLLQPGSGVATLSEEIPAAVAERGETGLADIVLHMVSPNLVQSAAETQLLPLIVFSLLFAAALTTIGTRGETVIAFFDGLNETMMKIVLWIMYLAPVGIFALVASRLGEAGGGSAFLAELSAVGMYVLTVLVGLTLHFAFLLVLLRVLGGRGGSYLRGMLRALLTAFGTASSSATLPLTMECSREAGVDDRAVRFVLPLGATINMDGTALYEAAAVMFIAQAYGYDMGLTEQIIVFLTATLAAVGAAGIPQAGLVTMILVLSAVKLPLEGIGLLLAVDWFLDRFRTTVNVWGDSVGAAVIARLFQPDPHALDDSPPRPSM
ncbi:MAG: dicarboxylate/amino acid:cation symporter [Gammaproteobacteria bacterium]